MDIDEAYVASELKRAQLLTEISAIAAMLRHENTKRDAGTCAATEKMLSALVKKYQ